MSSSNRQQLRPSRTGEGLTLCRVAGIGKWRLAGCRNFLHSTQPVFGDFDRDDINLLFTNEITALGLWIA